jgi:hypothetical protein
MSLARAVRRPVSTRHAFALALDLACVRDPFQSLVVPFLLRGPWVLSLAVLAGGGESSSPMSLALLGGLATLGASLTWWAVDAMLRIRARSVFNTLHGVPPAPVLECYGGGLRRLPWLYLTECVRNLALTFAGSLFLLPAVFLGYKLAFCTEAVVLRDRDLAGAFQRSFRLARGRFERWLELVVLSVLLVLAVSFVTSVVLALLGRFSGDTWTLVGLMVAVAVAPVIQYAWTFFYLRLTEVEEPPGQEVGPFYASSSLAGQWRATGRSEPHLEASQSAAASTGDAEKDGGA